MGRERVEEVIDQVLGEQEGGPRGVIAQFVLDWEDLSQQGFEEFSDALAKAGLHLGSVEEEAVGEVMSDTWYLYIADRKLRREELKQLDVWPFE